VVADVLLSRWYGFVRSQRCWACGSWPSGSVPVEAAHWRLVVSGKTGDLLPRSHRGLAAWGCIPLCRGCHLEQHRVGESAFVERLPRLGERWGSLLLGFFLEANDVDD
jgi:hypothetical protein